jgi:RNA polymerase sigma-70 factor (ECF subfamily)
MHCETEETVIYQDYQNILNQAIDRLPPQQKLVYGLCHGEGLKYEEAAQRLHISRLTVKTHMQQALRTIKSHFSHVIQVCLLIALGF